MAALRPPAVQPRYRMPSRPGAVFLAFRMAWRNLLMVGGVMRDLLMGVAKLVRR